MTDRNPELTAYRQGLHEATITERARAAIAAIDLPAQREAAASDAYTSTTLSN